MRLFHHTLVEMSEMLQVPHGRPLVPPLPSPQSYMMDKDTILKHAPLDRDELPFTGVVVGLDVLVQIVFATPCGKNNDKTKRNME